MNCSSQMGKTDFNAQAGGERKYRTLFGKVRLNTYIANQHVQNILLKLFKYRKVKTWKSPNLNLGEFRMWAPLAKRS